MSKRNTEIYVSALDYVNRNILPLNGGTIISDFQLAMRNGIRSIAPDVKMLGCWFHYCQALRRKVASNFTLFHLIRTNERAKSLFRKFQCLALLPADKNRPAFDQIAYQCLKDFSEFIPFVRYYDQQWIHRETPQKFSVFLQVIFMFIFKFIE